MHDVVFPQHGADAAPCRKLRHQDFRDCREPLRGHLPATPKQPTVWVVRSDRDGEEGVEDVCSSVPVNPEKGQARQAGDWGRLSGEAPQEGVDPPPSSAP